MKPVECPYEAEVLSAVLQSRWSGRDSTVLREHAAACGICSEVAAVASAFEASVDQIRSSAPVPDAGLVWWRAQMRARREAVEAAGRPISVLQAIAFACAAGLMGACFGATSTWFQAVLERMEAAAARIGAATLPAAGTLPLSHSVLALGLIAIFVLVPAAVCVALVKD
jgi:hypothetical protein